MSTILEKKLLLAVVKRRFLLNKLGSNKKTYHVELALQDPSLPFKVGDSIGIHPMNPPLIVDKILQLLHAKEEVVLDKRSQESLPIREFLLFKANLCKVTSSLYKACTKKPIIDSKKLLAYLSNYQVWDFLEKYPFQGDLPSFCSLLLPLLPRFYSIANAQNNPQGEIHLTVSYISYEQEGKSRYGIGSHFLCFLAELEKTPIPIFHFPTKDFTLPSDPTLPILMVGPGTGIAPFRAFLQERKSMQALGKNWLFFGEQKAAFDFYYQEYLQELENKDFLKLTTAFSRDQKEKIYVQHKLLENSKEVWQWVFAGSSIYVCGDAKNMARSVEEAFLQIFQKEGKMHDASAKDFLKNLKKEKRYLTDIY